MSSIGPYHMAHGGIVILLQVCYDVVCPPYQYRPSEDVFNAAQSGAMITDLVSHEMDYLVEELKKVW